MEKPLGRGAPALRARDLPSTYPTATRLQVKKRKHPMRQARCALGLVLNSQRKQLLHRRAHMKKKFAALIFGFSNHRLF